MATAKLPQWVSNSHAALFIAAEEMTKGGMTFHSHPDAELATNIRDHADSKIIRAWLTKNGLDAETELHVIYFLARSVRSEWVMRKRRTVSEHREQFQHIAEMCEKLKKSLDRTAEAYAGIYGYGMQSANVFDLLVESERHALDGVLKDECREYGCLRGCIFPSVEDVLDRLAQTAAHIEREGPMHKQPKKRGAERGHFVRRIGKIFANRYKSQPREVIAALTTIAIGEATDGELVTKLLR